MVVRIPFDVICFLLFFVTEPSKSEDDNIITGPAPTSGHHHDNSLDYFEFSPNLKARQCQKTIEIFQKCNLGDAFQKIPPIRRNFLRIKEIDLFFQVIVYMESNKTGSSEVLPFCQRGYCTACLLKGGVKCQAVYGSKPQQGYGSNFVQCLRNLTEEKVKKVDDLCLTKFCLGPSSGNGKKCRADSFVKPDARQNVNCSTYSYRGHNCYYVNTTTRTRLLSTGKLVDGVTQRSLHVTLRISLAMFILLNVIKY